MSQVFLSTNGTSIARAARLATGQWAVTTPLVNQAVTCLAADPLNHSTVYAGTRGGVLRVVGIEAGATVLSVDGGQSWTGHRRGALRDCHSLVFHASGGEWLYEGGGSGAGHAFSRDGGRTWSATREGLDRHYGWAAAADPERPEVWYLAASPSAFKAHSQNNAHAAIFRHAGARWQRLGGGLPHPLTAMPYALITDPRQPGQVYAGLSDGAVWHSPDYGEHWGVLPFHLGGIHRTLIMV